MKQVLPWNSWPTDYDYNRISHNEIALILLFSIRTPVWWGRTQCWLTSAYLRHWSLHFHNYQYVVASPLLSVAEAIDRLIFVYLPWQCVAVLWEQCVRCRISKYTLTVTSRTNLYLPSFYCLDLIEKICEGQSSGPLFCKAWQLQLRTRLKKLLSY